MAWSDQPHEGAASQDGQGTTPGQQPTFADSQMKTAKQVPIQFGSQSWNIDISSQSLWD